MIGRIPFKYSRRREIKLNKLVYFEKSTIITAIQGRFTSTNFGQINIRK